MEIIKSNLVLQSILEWEEHPNLDYSNYQEGPVFPNPNHDRDVYAIYAEGELQDEFGYDYMSIVSGDLPTKFGTYEIQVNMGGTLTPENQIIKATMSFELRHDHPEKMAIGLVHKIQEKN